LKQFRHYIPSQRTTPEAVFFRSDFERHLQTIILRYTLIKASRSHCLLDGGRPKRRY
jgi:hypothetical protein